MKKGWITVFTVLLAFIMLVGFAACEKDNGESGGGDKNGQNISDDDYTLEIYGIYDQPALVTKAQIKQLAQTKLVEYTWDNPCYASDKTDDDGNPIPHAVKGVYLDDILNEYVNQNESEPLYSGSFPAMTLIDDENNYSMIFTQEVYSVAHGGSDMIIAFEYDGITLNPNEKSGALRAVFPDQAMGAWVKKLKQIVFSEIEIEMPEAEKLNFIEMLDQKYYGSLQKGENTWYGISLAALFEDGLLQADENHKMYVEAWDFEEGEYKAFVRWTAYDYYSGALLANEVKEGQGPKTPYEQSYRFEGASGGKGMSIKNTLAVSVKKAALLSLENAFKVFDTDGDNALDFTVILERVNMYSETHSYTVTDIDGDQTVLTAPQLSQAVLSKTEEGYILTYGQSDSINIKSISKKAA